MAYSTSPSSWRRYLKEIKLTKTYGMFYQSKLKEETLEGNQTHQNIRHILSFRAHGGDIGRNQVNQNIWHLLLVQAHGGDYGRKSNTPKNMAYYSNPNA